MTTRNTESPAQIHQAITPMLAFRDAAGAIEFYTRAFGAAELARLAEPDGKIAHAEIAIGEGRVMIASEYPGYNHTPEELGGSSVVLHAYVPDADSFVDRAVAAGATLLIPVKDQFYGDRSGRIQDPFGYVWIIATHVQDVTADEMQRRFADS
jgi:PhnB protein